jgi:hypothetical protein
MPKYHSDSEVIPHLNSKNTRLYCNGKKDKEHVLMLEPSYGVTGKLLYYQVVCQSCGKKICFYHSKKNLEKSKYNDLPIKE